MKKTTDKATNYSSSYEELQQILQALEQGEIDVDELSVKVKRAAELIEFCQSRLKETEVEVKKVIDRFEKAQSGPVDLDEEDAAGPSSKTEKSVDLPF